MHKSFVDYLISADAGRFRITTCKAHLSAFDRCHATMETALHFSMGSIKSSYDLDDDDPELRSRLDACISRETRYACHHWAQHLMGTDSTSSATIAPHIKQLSLSLRELCQLRVLFWMEVMSLLMLTGPCRKAIDLAKMYASKSHVCFKLFPQMRNLLMVDMQNYALAEMLSDVESLWSSFNSDVAHLSTPHLYVSSLATELAMCANA